MSERKNTKIGLKPIDALLGLEDADKAVEVELARLHGFKNHPFRVVDDEDMYRLAESIRENGVLCPAVVREDGYGGYEIIAGHRRKRACELAEMETMPVIIKEMDDDEAIIYMVDSNIQRTEILVSEKAFASKMRYEAMKRQGKRTDLDGEEKKGSSIDELAKDYDCSPNQLRRLFRMTELIPGLLSLVDDKKFAFNSAVEISYLTKEEQEMVFAFMESDDVSPSLAQGRALRELSKKGEVTDEKVMEILLKEELNRDGLRPESLELVLTASNGRNYTAEVSDENGWEAAFNNLPVYASGGKEITYELLLPDVDGYATVFSKKDKNHDFVIMNTHKPETTSITITKIWDDGNDKDGMYDIRSELYERYADITIVEDGLTIEDTVQAIKKSIGDQT